MANVNNTTVKQPDMAEIKAQKEEASGRTKGTYKAGDKISQVGLQTMQANWVAGTAICAVGNGVKGYGELESGNTGRGLAIGFGGHLGEGISDLVSGDSAGDVLSRNMGMMQAGGSAIAGGMAKSGGPKGGTGGGGTPA